MSDELQDAQKLMNRIDTQIEETQQLMDDLLEQRIRLEQRMVEGWESRSTSDGTLPGHDPYHDHEYKGHYVRIGTRPGHHTVEVLLTDIGPSFAVSLECKRTFLHWMSALDHGKRMINGYGHQRSDIRSGEWEESDA